MEEIKDKLSYLLDLFQVTSNQERLEQKCRQIKEYLDTKISKEETNQEELIEEIISLKTQLTHFNFLLTIEEPSLDYPDEVENSQVKIISGRLERNEYSKEDLLKWKNAGYSLATLKSSLQNEYYQKQQFVIHLQYELQDQITQIKSISQ